MTSIEFVRSIVWILVRDCERVMFLEDSMIVYALGFVVREHKKIQKLFEEFEISFDSYSFLMTSQELSKILRSKLLFTYIAELDERRYNCDDSAIYMQAKEYFKEKGYEKEFFFLEEYLKMIIEQNMKGYINPNEANWENEYLLK